MILQSLEENGKYRATLQEKGAETVYDVSFNVCPNPVCMCNVVTINLVPAPDDPRSERGAPVREVPVDLERHKLADEGAVRKRGPARDFAKSVLKQMDEEDFDLLLSQYYGTKQRQTETARPEDIDVWFEYEQIDNEGLLTAYKDVLPYADPLLGALKGEQFLIIDQYCLKNGCSCTSVCLEIVRIDSENTRASERVGCYFVDYRKKRWRFADGPEAQKEWSDPQAARQAIEQQIPSIYSSLKQRHTRLTKIYNHCRAKHYDARHEPVRVTKVGRNDPCPCGSGRKYKQCCLGK